MAMHSARKANSAQWKNLRASILERDNYTCAYCGVQPCNSVDHVIPIARGGTDEWDNLVAACGTCNSRKRDRMPADFLARSSTNLSYRGFLSPRNGSVSYD